MRRLPLLLLVLLACERRAAKAPGPQTATAPNLGSPATVDMPLIDVSATPAPDKTPAPANTPTPKVPGLIADRGYERLVNSQRAATMRVRWRTVERDGQKLVEDVTQTRERTQRDMAGQMDTFATETRAVVLRTEDGELISDETVVTTSVRVDRETIERTAEGYRVTRSTGENTESFDIATHRPAMLDAEAFLVARIKRGEARPGTTFKVPLLDTQRKTVVEAELKVIGQDGEGPGLKVVQTLEGNDTLWWFADDGSVVRLRSGILVIRRDDAIRLENLPSRPASVRITLSSDIDLPRIFTTRRMLVDIAVDVDETTKPPRIADNPFTAVLEQTERKVTVEMRSHDDPTATCAYPIDPKGFEEYLKATPLMEVDDPDVRGLVKRLVGDAKDAREAARRIADFVFTTLVKQSPAIPEPTMKEILREECGDCSEHSLLFTGLCRAAGIPARRCSGWVCIGDDWGAHGWCEIWVGRWIGADPTTNEIGTRARYIFLSRPDEPEVRPSRITAERTSLSIRRAEYVDGTIDFTTGEPDLEILTGIRLGPVPEGWTVKHDHRGARIEGPDFKMFAAIRPDHGYRSMRLLLMQLGNGQKAIFGGHPAAVGFGGMRYLVPLGRELLDIYFQARGHNAPSIETIGKLFSPTLERQE